MASGSTYSIRCEHRALTARPRRGKMVNSPERVRVKTKGKVTDLSPVSQLELTVNVVNQVEAIPRSIDDAQKCPNPCPTARVAPTSRPHRDINNSRPHHHKPKPLTTNYF